jgi:hypothetical protein
MALGKLKKGRAQCQCSYWEDKFHHMRQCRVMHELECKPSSTGISNTNTGGLLSSET